MIQCCSDIENKLITALFKYRHFQVSIHSLPYLNHLLRTKCEYLLLKTSKCIYRILIQKNKPLSSTYIKITSGKIKYMMSFCSSSGKNRPHQAEILLQSKFLQSTLISLYFCCIPSHLLPTFNFNFNTDLWYQLHKESIWINLLYQYYFSAFNLLHSYTTVPETLPHSPLQF